MRRAFLLVGGVVCWGAWLTTASAGEIHGQILITRILTKKRVVLPAYQGRGVPLPAKQEEPIAIDEWERVVVYLEGENAPGKEPVMATLTQKNRGFEPEIMVIPVGSTVSFPNADPIFHNVFSLSKAKQFDLGYYPAGETRMVKFNQAGVVQVYCHLHADMNAAILVVPNAWYTEPEKEGSFAFPDLPAGTYQIVAWHKSAGFFRRQIQVPQNDSVEISIEIPIEERAEVR